MVRSMRSCGASLSRAAAVGRRTFTRRTRHLPYRFHASVGAIRASEREFEDPQILKSSNPQIPQILKSSRPQILKFREHGAVPRVTELQVPRYVEYPNGLNRSGIW